MKHTALLRLLWLPAVVGVLATCKDQTPTGAPNADAEAIQPTLGSSSHVTCDLTGTLTTQVRNYFSNPDKNAATDKMRQLSNACSAGDGDLTKLYAVQLLGMMETAFNAGRGGSSSLGSALANNLLACTGGSGCPASAVPNLDLASVLTPTGSGLFAIRSQLLGNASTSALSRAAIPFLQDGQSNTALFGTSVEPGWTWPSVNGGPDPIFIYGRPRSAASLTLRETGIGNLRYSFDKWAPGPALSPNFVQDGIVHVGVCFAQEVHMPHDSQTGKSTQPRMQREGTLLAAWTPDFCPPAPSAASLIAPVRALASLLMPRAWLFFGDIRTPVIGGDPLGWSIMAPVGAGTDGRLVMLEGPNTNVTANQSLGTIRIQALSENDTPMEAVTVEIYVKNNSGAPAGAVVANQTTAITVEPDGIATITGATISKPGGYIICARASLSGFTFTEDCSSMFWVK